MLGGGLAITSENFPALGGGGSNTNSRITSRLLGGGAFFNCWGFPLLSGELGLDFLAVPVFDFCWGWPFWGGGLGLLFLPDFGGDLLLLGD